MSRGIFLLLLLATMESTHICSSKLLKYVWLRLEEQSGEGFKFFLVFVDCLGKPTPPHPRQLWIQARILPLITEFKLFYMLQSLGHPQCTAVVVVCSPGLMVASSCHTATVPTVREEVETVQPGETALPSSFTILWIFKWSE